MFNNSTRLEWSYDDVNEDSGVTTKTIIRIETRGSDAGSSRVSSRKSTSTAKRRRRRHRGGGRRKLPVFLAIPDETHTLLGNDNNNNNINGGKIRCLVKTPFATRNNSSVATGSHNKKLRKKSMRHAQQQQQHYYHHHHHSLGSAGTAQWMSFYISPMHRSVAEATAPWEGVKNSPTGVQYQFLGQGGLGSSEPSSMFSHPSHATTTTAHSRNYLNQNDYYDDEEDYEECDVWPTSQKQIAPGVCGGSRVLAPLQSPSLLPPPHLLPASKAELSSDALEQCFLEATLNDDFSLS